MVDVGGIKDFISSSRKIKDLWASSYLASSIIWHALQPLIMYLGPDIAISPTMRFNPIYFSTLLGWLNTKGHAKVIDQIKNDLEDIISKLFHLDVFSEYPRYPIQPAIFTLSLPPATYIKEAINRYIDYLNRYFSEKAGNIGLSPEYINEYINELREIGSTLEDKKESIRNLIFRLIFSSWKLFSSIIFDEENYYGDTPLNKFLLESIKYIKKYCDPMEGNSLYGGYHTTPPLIIRVGVSRASDANELLSKLERSVNAREGSLKPLYFQLIIDKTWNDMVKIGRLRRTPYSKLDLSHNTEKYYLRWRNGKNRIGFPKKSKRGFDYCTSCSELPALILLPHKEDEFLELLSNYKIISDESEAEELAIYFSPGEKLCPYCFSKRIFATHTDISKLIMKWIYWSDKDLRITIPSTSDFSSLAYRKQLLEAILRSPSTMVSSMRDLGIENVIKNYYKSSKKLTPSLIHWKALNDKYSKIDNMRQPWYGVLIRAAPAEAKYMFLSEKKDVRLRWHELFKDRVRNILSSDSDKLQNAPGIYYGLVVADGDRMGKLVRGELYKALVKPKRYFRINKDTRKISVEEELLFYEKYYMSSLHKVSKEFRKYINDIMKAIVNLKCHKKRIDSDEWKQLVTKIGNIIELAELPEQLVFDLINLILCLFYRPRLSLDPNIEILEFEFAPSVLPSMSYQVAISRSLMLNALNNIRIVEEHGGIVVYNGGDDLMVVLPIVNYIKIDRDTQLFVNNSVEYKLTYDYIVYENLIKPLSKLRISYSEGTLNGTSLTEKIPKKYTYTGMRQYRDNIKSIGEDISGFYMIEISGSKYYIPVLYGMGWSISAGIVHYRYPLYRAVEIVTKYLEKYSKDGSLWDYRCSTDAIETTADRDGLTFIYISGGKPIHVTLPNKLWHSQDIEPRELYSYYTYYLLSLLYDSLLFDILSISYPRDILKDPFMNTMDSYQIEKSISTNIANESAFKKLIRRYAEKNKGARKPNDAFIDLIVSLEHNISYRVKAYSNSSRPESRDIILSFMDALIYIWGARRVGG
jgi:CRISPR-associated protein Cmr2